MIVEEKSSSFSFLNIASNSHATMQMPEIKASLDKNKSQRIGILV
jgi:hypothetical protein